MRKTNTLKIQIRALTSLLFVAGAILVFALTTPTQAEFFRTLSFAEPVTGTSSSAVAFPILFNNDEIPVNAERIVVNYDPSALFVYGVDINEALCEERFIISNEINYEAGKITLECGTVSPVSGTTTVLATLFALPFSESTTTLSFDASSGIYAHDGLGTQVVEELIPLSVSFDN